MMMIMMMILWGRCMIRDDEMLLLRGLESTHLLTD